MTDIETRLDYLRDEMARIEKMNNDMLDLELQMRSAQINGEGATFARLQTEYEAVIADAKRAQFRFDRLNAEVSNMIALARLQALQAVANGLQGVRDVVPS